MAGIGNGCVFRRCVVTGTSAVIYAQSVWTYLPLELPVVILLAVFALLSVWGIRDSSNVAMALYFLHICTMAIILIGSVVYMVKDGGALLISNYHHPFPDVMDGSRVAFHGNAFHAIFFGAVSFLLLRWALCTCFVCCGVPPGVAQGLLGITGFETSANYVEEQAPGVYQKTLFNMWAAATFFNPALALVALGVCTWDELQEHPNDVLAFMGKKISGVGLQYFIAVDATLVLAATILTAYVGVTGLVRRLAMDQVMPKFMLATNKWRGTNHVIVLSFFLVCTSLLFALNGNVATLSGVFTIAFLSVMVRSEPFVYPIGPIP